jgi:hypothetical protein
MANISSMIHGKLKKNDLHMKVCCKITLTYHPIDGVMVSMLVLSAVDRGFNL